MSYRAAAIAAHEAEERARADAIKAERSELASSARTVGAPLFKGADGSPAVEPSEIETLLVDMRARMVVVRVDDGDGAPLVFAIYPDRGESFLVKRVDGQWQQGPRVSRLSAVGAVLVGGDW